MQVQQPEVQHMQVQQPEVQHADPGHLLAQDTPLVNFQLMLQEQGVPFFAGVPPPLSNLADSPMQAWTDSISDNSSSSVENMDLDVLGSVQINSFSLNNASFQDLHAEIWARVTLVKALVNSTPSPMTDGKFLSIQMQVPTSVLFEMVHEFLNLTNGRKVARTASSLGPLSIPDTEVIEQIDSIAHVGQKRKKVSIAMPESTLQVRRSPRTNKYDGFKPRNDSDTKTVKSKVKPRKDPSKQKATADTPAAPSNSAVTPIPVLQSIGINLCGIPPTEVSSQKLLSPLQEGSSSDSSA
jgi:hypothetical protein